VEVVVLVFIIQEGMPKDTVVVKAVVWIVLVVTVAGVVIGVESAGITGGAFMISLALSEDSGTHSNVPGTNVTPSAPLTHFNKATDGMKPAAQCGVHVLPTPMLLPSLQGRPLAPMMPCGA